jgi:Phage integrase, N-terminal SAM-like domain
MIEDMTSGRLAPRTPEAYIRAVKNFTAFFGGSPDQARAEDLRRYHLHLASTDTTTPPPEHAPPPIIGRRPRTLNNNGLSSGQEHKR